MTVLRTTDCLLVAALAVAAGCSAPQPLGAVAGPADHDRPERLVDELLRGSHPQTLREGGLEARVDYVRTGSDTLGTTDEPVVGLDYGVTDRFTVGAQLFRDPRTHSFDTAIGESEDNVGVSAMYALKEDGLAQSLRLEIIFNDDRVEYRPEYLVAMDLFGGEAYAGIGGAFKDDEPAKERLTHSFGYTHHLSRALIGMFEVDGYTDFDGQYELFVTPGVAFNVRRRLQIRVGTPIGVGNDSADYQILVGLGISF